MTTVVLAALGIAFGVPTLLLVLGAAAAVHPGLALALISGHAAVGAWRRRRARPGPDDEAEVLQILSAELTGGASLRSALVAAAERCTLLPLGRAARSAAAGLPAATVAGMLASALPVNGRMAGAAWLLAAESGGPAAAVMQTLAVRSAREGELVRERRALTAQARASAWVVAGLPAMLLLGVFASGRLDAAGDPAMGLVVVVGVALQGAGVAVVALMVRRSER